MNQVIRTFCEEKNIRFGQGYADGMEEFFAIDGNGIFLIYGRPIVGATQGEVVVRGDATRYLSELVARLDRNGNTVRVNGNTLSVVFKLRTPMGYGVPRRIPTPPTPPTPSGNYLYFEAKQANSTVGMTSSLATPPSLEYSEDGETWQTWEETSGTFDTITLGAVGDKVYLRGTNAALSDMANQKMSIFMPTGNVKIGGSVQSLVDGTGESTTAIEMVGLFASGMMGGSTTALTEIESGFLSATSLTAYCYSSMFYGCPAITNAPHLPATTLTDFCYYGMFMGCTALTASPILQATTLATTSYSMMFNGCTSLNSVTCLATDISATDCVKDWLNSVAASGTLYKAPAMTGWVEGTNYPSGWTLTDYAG